MHPALFHLVVLTEENKEFICLLVGQGKVDEVLHKPTQLVKDQVLVLFHLDKLLLLLCQ